MTRENIRRRIILGSGTAAGIVIFLAILIAAQYIILQNPKRWDLTHAKRFTLSSQSKNVLESFRKNQTPIDVLAFYESKDQGDRDEVRDLLEQYRDVYSKFHYSFVDPDKERAVAMANKIDAYPTTILKAGQKEERISTVDEETVTNALVKLLRSETKKVYMLKGHGELSPEATNETGFSVAKSQIEKQNYKVEELVLLQTPEVPTDAAVLVIAGPKTDPMDSEMDAIRAYLNRGGSLLVLLNPFKTPKLAAFLKDYGFLTADDIVVDRMSRAMGGDYLMPVIVSYVKFPITKNFNVASFFPEARSVRAESDTKRGIEAQELALTSPVSWTINEEQLKSGNANFDEKTGMKGPVSVMAVSQVPTKEAASEPKEKADEASEKKNGEKQGGEEAKQQKDATGGEQQSKPKKARIVVMGSSLMAANKYYKLQGNGDLFMNTVSWLAEDENLISIRPKSLKAQPFVLTARQATVFFVIPVVLMPLIWVAAGIVVYVYRRRAVKAASS
jgi:ABC-type uncharacterized transport system involved in gliding motility auxiliary subunit